MLVNRIAVAAVAVMAMGMIGVAGRTADTSGRAKIFGIAYVKVRVTDLEKAKAFYGGVMGLRPSFRRNGQDAAASYQVNVDQTVELIKTDAGTPGSYLAEVGLATDDVIKMRTYLLSRGVAVSQVLLWPNESRGDATKHIAVTDPEGNRIVFVEQYRNHDELTSPGAISGKLLHAGFVVKDWKAENRFYEDVLGFRLYWKGGFKDDGLDWYEIQVPDGDNWIEYMLNIPANADHKELGVQNHFSLGVKSADEAAKTLRARGLKDFDGPEVGRDGKNSLDAYDPDWTRVEVMEFVPSGKVCCSEYGGKHPRE